jgi:shikimate kinase
VNILLIGYRGSGKSTVGPLLARRLGYTCIDADAELQRRAGRTIKEIFEHHGEPAFRELEAQLLEDFAGGDRQVIALGGGVVLRTENRDALRSAGFVVWLTADVDTLLTRIQSDATTATARPKLTAAGGRDEIVRLLAQREPLYRACAELVLDTTHATPAEIVEAIVERLHDEGRNPNV